jgi:hypothetical protein
MKILYCFVAMGLALIAAGPMAFAQDSLPAAFSGMFRGTLSGTTGETGAEFTVQIKQDGDGFTVAWPPRISASFESAGRPGVFRASGNSQILEGEPVYWARIENEILTVYAAQIDEHGGYRIDNFLYTPSEGGLDLVIRHVVTGAEPQVSNGKLNRYGG